MYLGNLSDVDQSIAKVVRWIAIVLLGGLTATGVWQFFFHEADTSWSRYRLGSELYLNPVDSSGIAETHAAFADLAGALTLFVIAWVSARVLHRVSWSAIGALLLVIASLYTGTLIRYNATFQDGAVSTNTRGYGQFFWGSPDGIVTDRFELDRLTVVGWTVLHIISVPVLLLAVSFTLKRADARRIDRKGKSQSWLDALPSPTRTTNRGR